MQFILKNFLEPFLYLRRPIPLHLGATARSLLCAYAGTTFRKSGFQFDIEGEEVKLTALPQLHTAVFDESG